MKKLNIFASALIVAATLVSCETDRDDNPRVQMPTDAVALKMLDPEVGSNIVDLETSNSIQFKLAQPAQYGYPADVTYGMDVAIDESFSNFFALSTTTKSTVYDAPGTEIDLAINKLKGWENEEDVDKTTPIDVYVRMNAKLSTVSDSSTYQVSDVKKITVYPYFLQESLPQVWYLTGGIIADGGWGNDPALIGTSMIPMYVKEGAEYNKFTGIGTIEYVGYFPAGDFKIIAPKGLVNWNYSMAGGNLQSGGFGYRNGGDDPGNISNAEAGYYRLTLSGTDTDAPDMKAEKYTDPVTDYASMSLKGAGVDVALFPMTTLSGSFNHDWYGTVTVSGNADVKFESGDTKWGTTKFPYGISTVGGNAIPMTAGTYVIYFNDITGAFMFTIQK